MNKAQHPSNNAILGAPVGVPIEECGALPVTHVLFPDGQCAVVSFWRPSAEDLALLNGGQCVRICLWGSVHAPISVGVDGDGEIRLLPSESRAG